MRNIVRVNIYNEGRILGIKTPVYNFPLDYETFVLFKEMGFQIEMCKPEPVKSEATAPKVVTQEVADVKIVKEVAAQPVDEVEVEQPEEEFEIWATKDVYTKEELLPLSKAELVSILHYRGHYSFRTGKRDKLAPKFDDNKTILIEKILKTNKAE